LRKGVLVDRDVLLAPHRRRLGFGKGSNAAAGDRDEGGRNLLRMRDALGGSRSTRVRDFYHYIYPLLFLTQIFIYIDISYFYSYF
jgi:hypothetical protein